MDIRSDLSEKRLLMDGAMGTYFDKVAETEFLCSEEANIIDPAFIKEIHMEYIRKGARLIRSNTFTANRDMLEKVKRRREEFAALSYEEWVQAGYLLSVEAVKEAEQEGYRVYAAASIGPIAEKEEDDREDMLRQYYEICDLLLQAGCQHFVIETFPDEYYVLRMADHIRRVRKDAWILGQFSFMPTGYSSSGFHVSTVLTKAIESGKLDAVGLNCGIGANHMNRILRKYLASCRLPEGVVLAALPNCGYPQIVRGKAVYSDSVPYFSRQLREIAAQGIRIIGGCCGTTPDYIGAISQWIEDEEIHTPVRIISGQEAKEKADHRIVTNSFYEKLKKGQKVYAVELDPPYDTDCSKLMNGARELIATRTDIITLADSPMARSRADSLIMAAKVKRETGMQVMPHLTSRDRNRISIRGGILGAYINDIRNCLLVTGDPVSRADQEYTRSVYNFNSIKCMRYLKHMNEEIFSEDPFIYGGALNQDGVNTEAIARRMKKKMDEGCSYFLTQPVYSEQSIERLKRLKDMTDARILVGIMPLVSYRNAVFIQNEMPGIYVPEEAVALYRKDGDKEEWEQVAVDYSLRMMRACEEIGSGYYMMTPFNRVHLVKRILELYHP